MNETLRAAIDRACRPMGIVPDATPAPGTLVSFEDGAVVIAIAPRSGWYHVTTCCSTSDAAVAKRIGRAFAAAIGVLEALAMLDAVAKAGH